MMLAPMSWEVPHRFGVFFLSLVGFYLSFAKDIETEEPLDFTGSARMKFSKDLVSNQEMGPSLKLTAKAPEHRPSQKEIHLPTMNFRCYVSFI